MGSLSDMLPKGIAEPDLVGRIRRGKQFRSVGVFGAVGSIAVFAASKLIPLAGGTLGAILLTLLVASLTLIAWTRLWFKESREPFQYTYSVGELEPVPDLEAEGAPSVDRDPFLWLTHDLKEKLSERVPRLSLLDEETVPAAEPGDDPASHVHISGWYGLRNDGSGWEFEVVPEVRLGGKGAPARLASSVQLRLDVSTAKGPLNHPKWPPKLSDDGYGMLFERVYWSVASQIYAQIQRGVEEKVKLLPWGSLRASAYVHEAEDYATSNTLDAYAAAQQLYRRALEIYDVRYREPAASPWRKKGYEVLEWISDRRRSLRRSRAGVWRRAGRRDVMTARAEIGLARMLVAEWHLGQLCGMVRKEIYESTEFVVHAIARLRSLPVDVAERQTTMFRAHVTLATIRLLLQDRPGARIALSEAKQLLPGKAREDADYLFAAGMIESDRLPSLRLLGQAVELEPTMERALFHRAEQFDEIWRRREPWETEVANAVDARYQDVIALNPGNLSAWGRRGYLGWLLAEKESGGDKRARWREQAISALETGRQYKEVRRDASVAELDWNLARLAAEKGDFPGAYGHYAEAVSARLADPRIDFEQNFYLSPTKALVRRFSRYQGQVMWMAVEAEEAAPDQERLIKAVKAFVLNDCGLAYQAHYERSGSEESLMRASGAFEAAQREYDAFVLPAHNLAKLFQQLSELPGKSPEEVKQALQSAIELLEKVFRRERQWAPARLLMVEVQAQLAYVAGLRQGGESDDGHPSGTDLDAVQVARRAARMGELREAAYAVAVRELQALLPHKELRSETRIDLEGAHIKSLLEDRQVRWTKDFDAFHVAALIRWSMILAVTAPAAADSLCEWLRATYSHAEVGLLSSHRIAATALAARDGGVGGAAQGTVEECDLLYREIIDAALRQDPAHLAPLRETVRLPANERRRALQTALDANPSATALVWIGDAQQELDEFEAAISTYERARRQAQTSIKPVAALKLGMLLEERGIRTLDAVEAYRAATESRHAADAADAADRAARLLRSVGNVEDAKDECMRAAARPEVALHLASSLVGEGLVDEAVLAYRKALAADREDGTWRGELLISLAVTLMTKSEGRVAEAEELLLEVGEAGLPPLAWEATVILARALTADEPTEARLFYERVLAEADSMAVTIATWELGAMMEEAEEGEAAGQLYLERAQADPVVKAGLVELMREREDDVDAFLAKVDAGPPSPPPAAAAA